MDDRRSASRSSGRPQLSFCNNLAIPAITQGFNLRLLLFWELQQTKPLSYSVRGNSMAFRKLLFGKVITDYFVMQLLSIDHRIPVFLGFRF